MSEIEVEMPVTNIKQARSKKVLEYCVKELSSGTTWSELRRKLGLGPTHVDARWRAIRELLTSAVLPKNEEEALKAQISSTEMMMAKLEELIEYIEERTSDKVGRKDEDKFLKLQLDALKLQMERNEKRFEHFIEMKKLQKDDKKNQGPSIIYQNNYYVPRPGDDAREVIAHKEDNSLVETARLTKALNESDNS